MPAIKKEPGKPSDDSQISGGVISESNSAKHPGNTKLSPPPPPVSVASSSMLPVAGGGGGGSGGPSGRGGGQTGLQTEGGIALCASCDRCRSRKTKCDGKRPCGNCIAKYLKKHRLSSAEGVDPSLFECVYSPAKRRGPVPGRAAGSRQKDPRTSSPGPTGVSGANVVGDASVGSSGLTMTGRSISRRVSGVGGSSVGGGSVGPAVGTSRGSREPTSSGLASAIGTGTGTGGTGTTNGHGTSGNRSVQGSMPMMGPSSSLGAASQGFMSLPSEQNVLNNTSGATPTTATATSAEEALAIRRQLLMQQQMALAGGGAATAGSASPRALFDSQPPSASPLMMGMGISPGMLSSASSLEAQQLNLLQQLQAQQKSLLQQQIAQQQQQQQQQQASAHQSSARLAAHQGTQISRGEGGERPQLTFGPSLDGHIPNIANDVPMTDATAALGQSSRTVSDNLRLLSRSDPDGNRLRSYYDLSMDELFNLPPIPTDEEYCRRLRVPIDPSQLPRFDQAAMHAARFAEVAFGALANNQVPLALELSNATVACLRECVEEPVHPSCMFDVARAYFLHGVFRSFRGDMPRYFKYRRVCLTHLSQLDSISGVEALLAAIAFHDSWAYMVYNGGEDPLPEIDNAIPPLPRIAQSQPGASASASASAGDSSSNKFGISTKPSDVASDPANQMWIQGAPPIFINHDAPGLSRAIDALACAIRQCCDQANGRFGGLVSDVDNSTDLEKVTPTSTAVAAHESDLCSRTMVISAFTLLKQHEAFSTSLNRNLGLQMIIAAMDAFLEGGDEEAGGFTDSQIQSLLTVCNMVIEQPLLLYQGGPTYHMVTNAAVLLCHLLNGLRVSYNDMSGGMEEALFDEVCDTYLAVRKILNVHRRKLPAKIRCHGVPRPNFNATTNSSDDSNASRPFVDLSETIMCPCRGCQGFVLMACSPPVAAARAKAAAERQATADATGLSKGELEALDKEIEELGAEFDVDDDALLNVLSRIIAT